jgi:hypothetical protein
MSPMNIEQLKSAFLTLAPEKRQEFFDYALALAPIGEDTAIEQRWLAEAKHRLAEVMAGSAKMIPAAQVLAELRADV